MINKLTCCTHLLCFLVILSTVWFQKVEGCFIERGIYYEQYSIYNHLKTYMHVLGTKNVTKFDGFFFQLLVGTECVPAIHRMEQISSEEGIGSLSENLMEALKSNPDVAKKVKLYNADFIASLAYLHTLMQFSFKEQEKESHCQYHFWNDFTLKISRQLPTPPLTPLVSFAGGSFANL